MVWTDFHFFSTTLEIQTAAYVLLPDAHVLQQDGGKPLPTLYLLHGLSDDHTMWLRNTRIEQFARKYRVAVVMPAVNRSFYTDMAYGAKYFTFVSKELPHVMEAYFPLSKKREDRFAAGLSMGGYGAMKLGLRCPNRYAAVASLSGALVMEESMALDANPPEFRHELRAIFGDGETLAHGSDGLLTLAKRLCKAPEKSPKIYIACGTEDFLFEANEYFVETFGKTLPIEYHKGPGSHTWDFWDKHIEQVLAWLPLKASENVW